MNQEGKTELQLRVEKAREEYLKRTEGLYLQLFDIRQKQTIKYLFNHLNNTLEPIVFESNEEKLVLSKIDTILNEIYKKYNLNQPS